MTTVRVAPGPVRGRIRAPSSKSYTHRALVVGHFSERPFVVHRPLRSDDTLATVRALRSLGDRVDLGPERWTIRRGVPPRGRVRIDCRQSGTTLRFMAAVAPATGASVRLEGEGRLPRRPMAPLVDALRTLGVEVHVGARGLPIDTDGRLRGGSIRLDASQSSQFTSALLLVLPTVEPASRIDLTGPIVSETYIEATVAVLRAAQMRVAWSGRTIHIPGGQRYSTRRFEVPGDASSAAYLLAAAAVSGGTVTVGGLDPEWPQADLRVLDLLGRAGASVRRSGSNATVTGQGLTGFEIDLTESPDLYPLAGVIAAQARGTSRLLGAAHVAWKESDRRRSTTRLARAFGARVEDRGGRLSITGAPAPPGARLGGLEDHRLVMSAAVGALGARGASRISDADAVGKSYPEFWTDLGRLGAAVVQS